MYSNLRHVKAKAFSAILALLFCVSFAQAKESTVDYGFRIVDGTRTTSISISLPKDLDTNFPAPRSISDINVAQVYSDQLVTQGVELLDRWSGIFRGPLFHRLSGSVGVMVLLYKDLDHKSLAELHAVWGNKLERLSKTYRNREVVVSEIAMVGPYRYSHYKTRANERIGFDEHYLLPLHGGYYLRFLFVYTSNNYKPDINAATAAQGHADIDQAMQSVSVSEGTQ